MPGINVGVAKIVILPFVLGYRSWNNRWTNFSKTVDSACVLCTHTVSMYSIDTTGVRISFPVIYFGYLSYSRPLENISLYLTLKCHVLNFASWSRKQCTLWWRCTHFDGQIWNLANIDGRYVLYVQTLDALKIWRWKSTYLGLHSLLLLSSTVNFTDMQLTIRQFVLTDPPFQVCCILPIPARHMAPAIMWCHVTRSTLGPSRVRPIEGWVGFITLITCLGRIWRHSGRYPLENVVIYPWVWIELSRWNWVIYACTKNPECSPRMPLNVFTMAVLVRESSRKCPSRLFFAVQGALCPHLVLVPVTPAVHGQIFWSNFLVKFGS
jgi:hypothetical protein